MVVSSLSYLSASYILDSERKKQATQDANGHRQKSLSKSLLSQTKRECHPSQKKIFQTLLSLLPSFSTFLWYQTQQKIL